MSGVVSFFAEGMAMPKFKKREAKSWIKEVVLAEQKITGALNYIFVSDAHLLEMNKKYLNHDDLTDIITFDNSDDPNIVEGDMYISIDRVKENSRIFSSTFHVELHRVIIHGALHLCGYKDKTEKQSIQMRTKENEALNKLRNTELELSVPRGTTNSDV